MTPFNALTVTLTTTHSDPLGPAVIELGAAGARIDPASDRDPVLDVVFETRVDPGRPLPQVTTNWFGILPEHVRGQPRLPEALAQLRTVADRFRPDVLVTHHPPVLTDVLPDLARRLRPREPVWVSTFSLGHHVWPFNPYGTEALAALNARRETEARGLDPFQPGYTVVSLAFILAHQTRALVEAGHAATPAALHAWSDTPAVLAAVPCGWKYHGFPWTWVPREICKHIVATGQPAVGSRFPPALQAMAVATAEAALRGEYAVELAGATPPAAAA